MAKKKSKVIGTDNKKATDKKIIVKESSTSEENIEKDNIVEEIKNLGKDKKDKPMISPVNRFNIVFVDLQIIFTVATIVCLIWYLFNPKLWYVLQVVLGITMLIIGYNNKIIYNKPKMSYVYYAIGVVLIVFDILLILGV